MFGRFATEGRIKIVQQAQHIQEPSVADTAGASRHPGRIGAGQCGPGHAGDDRQRCAGFRPSLPYAWGAGKHQAAGAWPDYIKVSGLR